MARGECVREVSGGHLRRASRFYIIYIMCIHTLHIYMYIIIYFRKTIPTFVLYVHIMRVNACASVQHFNRNLPTMVTVFSLLLFFFLQSFKRKRFK